jgi:hypothetical protein
MAAENIAHRLIREPETQVGHGAHDPVLAPLVKEVTALDLA